LLNHCGYSQVEAYNDPVQHRKGNSPDLNLNIIFERVSGLGKDSTDPVFLVMHTETNEIQRD